ncbi:MAG TPA: biopolymer transporter ExbD [Chitinophagaceae bacterium]|nr:biopolymer transporter ExbD [Chitinophagaceae bacterium]
MADIQQKESRSKRAGVTCSKKLSTKVDLTPMVDLGFLLITFFVFTNTVSIPTAMDLKMPDTKNIKDSSEAPLSKTISLLPAGGNKIFYYTGLNADHIEATDYSAAGIRAVLQNMKATLRKNYGKDDDMVVLIKPTSASTYGNTIDMLDEMTINAIKTYVLMDASVEEEAIVKQ